MSQEEKCLDKEMNGVCSKGKDCEICNKIKPKEEQTLNVNAQEYRPRKKKEEEKLNFNLNAKEYVPKQQEENPEEEEENNEEIDMIMRDVVENDILDEMGENNSLDSDSADEDKWYPKYKDCECCKGFVYKCKGEACQSLGQCYCKMKDDCDEEN